VGFQSLSARCVSTARIGPFDEGAGIVTEDLRPAGLASTAGFAWGYNNSGGLGIGSVARALHPVAVRLPAGTIDVQGGTDFTIALTESGQVWTWGGNRYGQLGDGTATIRFAPRQVELAGSAPAASIAVGQDHVLALTRQGAIYAWGRNHHGQLGDGTAIDRAAPVQVPVPDAVQVAAGNAGSAALTASGAALIWGRALRGQAGIAGADLASPRPLTLPEGTTPAMVDAGQRHLVVLTSHGELLTFGVDPGGRPLPDSLPLDPSWGHVESVSAGDNHTVALTDTGVVLAWGANQHGQLGTRDTTRRQAPVQVPIPELGGGRVVELIAGGDSALARTSEHQVYSWGHGGFGQNGNGATADQTRPQPVHILAGAAVTGIYTGRYHCLARRS
jgi:alpha-tubulin suppressor-like RCC1 family protein